MNAAWKAVAEFEHDEAPFGTNGGGESPAPVLALQQAMKLPSRPGSAPALVFITLGLLLCVLSGLKAVPLLWGARNAALDGTGQAIARSVAPLVEQQRIPHVLTVTVQRLVNTPSPALSYITVANADGVILVSRGRLGDALSWLPAAQARRWRSWLYRVSAAENTRPLVRDGRRIGAIRYGVPWSVVFARAGTSFLRWLGVLGLGILLCCIGLGRIRGRAPAEAQASTRAARGVFSRRRSADETKPVARLGRRSSRGGDFVPIAGPAEQASAPRSRMETPASDDRVPAAAATTQPIGPSAVVRSASETTAPAPVVASVHEKLGDTTLDLRFFPIWRGTDRRVLAGAWAALAWRRGAGEMVDAAALTRLAEQDGVLRTFTQWIARRFSVLHSNWRTLELATVPIVLPVPSALLAFADAEVVWRAALRHVDRDPSDLILRVERVDDQGSPPILPIRRARMLGADGADDSLSPAAGDIVCVTPAALAGNAADTVARLSRGRGSVLLGPVVDPQSWASVIERGNVCWYSDAPQADNLHTPRSFARLLATYRTAPL